jgi:hypothetical protein
MSIGDMFDAAFKLYRRHFLIFIGIVALVQVPMAIVQYLLQYVVGRAATLDVLQFSARPPVFRPGQNPLDSLPINSFLTFYAITIGVGVFQGLIIQSLITGALATAISRSYLGQPISILDAYRFGLRRYLSLIGAAMLLLLVGAFMLLVFAGCSFGVVVAFAATLRGSQATTLATLLGALFVVGVVLLFIPVVLFFFIRFILSTQAIVLEGLGPLSGLARSWRLVGKSFWRALLIFVLVLVLSYIISVIPSLLALFGLNLISGGAATAQLRNQAIGTFIAQIGLILGLPLLFSIYTLLYYDLRIRKEGYDIELMAQQAASP